MELNYRDLFSLVAVNRFSRLFNQYNMLVQSLNMRTESLQHALKQPSFAMQRPFAVVIEREITPMSK